MARERTKRGLTTAPLRRTDKGCVVDLNNCGAHLYMTKDGHVFLNGTNPETGRKDGYPFTSPLQFVEALSVLLRRMEKTNKARR